MGRNTPTLAKLSRPRLYRVAPRERLFLRLDACRTRPVVWISGPPGAGKTTAIATYIDSRRLRATWYQADEGDGDPGTFFYYLAQAASRTARKGAALPLFTPEYVGDLAGFARRFFREFFARMPGDGCFVLDNYQEVAASSPFQSVVAEALGEIPDGVNVFVVSREQPPPACARLLANDRIAQLEWADLRLTREETAAVAAAKERFDERRIDELYAQSNGWAAGLVLMLERLARTGAVNRIEQTETMDAVFNYFAGQFYDQVPADVRHVLTATAYMPAMTGRMAQSLSGDANAGHVLEQLHRSHLFTERKTGEELRYEYHALFRAFLRERARQSLTDHERTTLVTRSAQLLDESGAPDDALPLYASNGLWDAAVALIVRNARRLITQGRWLTLNYWIGLIPADRIAASPELTLWQGSSLILVDPATARAMLERVFDQFAARDDVIGQALAATGIVESCNIEFSRFHLLDPWIVVLERVLARKQQFPTVNVEIRAYAALMLAAMWRRPDHPGLAGYAKQVATLLECTDNLTAKADVATQLLEYYVFTGHQQQARALIAKVGSLFDVAEVSRLRRSSWWIVAAFHWTMAGEDRNAERAAERAHAIAREYEQNWVDFFHGVVRVLLRLLGGDLMRGAALLEKACAQLNEERPPEVAVFALAQCLLAQVRGETRQAAHFAQRCIDASEESGGAYVRIFCPLVTAVALMDAGECNRARAVVDGVRAMSAGTCYAPYDALLLMVEAYSLLASDRPRAHALLARALVTARETGTESYFRMLVVAFPRVLGEALEAGIERDYCATLIRRFGIAPHRYDIEAWPWPIRIHTLGPFSITIDDVSMKSAGKTQRRPMDLLKFIVAMGGRQVQAAAAVDALWGEFEGDADHAFDSTLHRLRRLLGRDDAIEHADGMLSLNARVVWVDIWALERVFDEITKANGQARCATPAETAERVLSLYRGHFLEGDKESSFAAAMRDRLRSKLIRALCGIGDACEAESRWDEAARIYERGLELDNLAEELYRRLIIAHQARGQFASGLEVYRRCGQMLSVVLGVKPCAAIEALHQSLKAAQLRGAQT